MSTAIEREPVRLISALYVCSVNASLRNYENSLSCKICTFLMFWFLFSFSLGLFIRSIHLDDTLQLFLINMCMLGRGLFVIGFFLTVATRRLTWAHRPVENWRLKDCIALLLHFCLYHKHKMSHFESFMKNINIKQMICMFWAFASWIVM